MLGEVYSDISSNIQLLVYMYIHTYVNPAGGRRSRWRRCGATHIIGSSSSPPHTAQKKFVCRNLTCLFGRHIIRVYPKLLSAATGPQITVITTTGDRCEGRARALTELHGRQDSCKFHVVIGHWPSQIGLAFGRRKSSGNIVQFVTGV